MEGKKLRKKEVGSFSIKYLTYLFLKYRKDHIPELEEDFIKRRYIEDEFDEYGNVIIEPKRSTKSKNFSNLKNDISRNLQEEEILQDTSKDRIRQYIDQVRNQIDKYDAENEMDFDREVQSLSNPILGNYSNRKSGRYNSNNKSVSVRRDFYKHDIDSQDIDDFVSRNIARKGTSNVRKSRKSRSREETKQDDFIFENDIQDLDSFDDSIIDERYLDSLGDESFFENEISKKSTTSSRSRKENNKDDIDDFLSKI